MIWLKQCTKRRCRFSSTTNWNIKRVVVIDLYDDKGPYVLINPEIIKEKGEQEVDEGCLSFPDKFGKVKRPAEVVVKALDRDGKEYKLKGKDY